MHYDPWYALYIKQSILIIAVPSSLVSQLTALHQFSFNSLNYCNYFLQYYSMMLECMLIVSMGTVEKNELSLLFCNHNSFRNLKEVHDNL